METINITEFEDFVKEMTFVCEERDVVFLKDIKWFINKKKSELLEDECKSKEIKQKRNEK